MHTNQQLVVSDGRLGSVLAQDRLRVEALENERSHSPSTVERDVHHAQASIGVALSRSPCQSGSQPSWYQVSSRLTADA